MSDQTRQQLQQALELIKSGQREQARALLESVVKADPNNADAWWIMATAVTSPAAMRDALQNVLRIRPDYPNAQQMLDRVIAQLNLAGGAQVVPRPVATEPTASSEMPTTLSSAAPTPPPEPTVPTTPPQTQPSTPMFTPATPPSSATPSPSGSQISESVDDLFAPLPPSGGPASQQPPAAGPRTYTPPPYVPPPPSQMQRKGRSPLLYILIGLALAVVCVCGACLLLTGGSLAAIFGNPTVQAAFGTGFAMIDAPQQLPSDAQKMGTINPNQQKSGQAEFLKSQVWSYQGMSNEAITITVTMSGSNATPYIGLYDRNGNLVTKTQLGSSTGRTKTLSTTLTDDGTYSILVGAIAGNRTGYTIQVQSGSRQ